VEHSDLKENMPELLPAARPSTNKVYNAIRQAINEEISFYHATARHLTQTIKNTMIGL
jgi:DNA replicative helicase MCM subunit Mcm2 (Cdc46/Mcm family)